MYKARRPKGIREEDRAQDKRNARSERERSERHQKRGPEKGMGSALVEIVSRGPLQSLRTLDFRLFPEWGETLSLFLPSSSHAPSTSISARGEEGGPPSTLPLRD